MLRLTSFFFSHFTNVAAFLSAASSSSSLGANSISSSSTSAGAPPLPASSLRVSGLASFLATGCSSSAALSRNPRLIISASASFRIFSGIALSSASFASAFPMSMYLLSSASTGYFFSSVRRYSASAGVTSSSMSSVLARRSSRSLLRSSGTAPGASSGTASSATSSSGAPPFSGTSPSPASSAVASADLSLAISVRDIPFSFNGVEGALGIPGAAFFSMSSGVRAFPSSVPFFKFSYSLHHPVSLKAFGFSL